MGGKEFLIPLAVLAHSMDEVDQSLPATRSSVESDKFLENVFSKHPASGDDVAHGSKAEEWEAALIITGTAVGGGSLALPYFCAAGVFFRRSRFCSSRTGFSSGRRWF